MSSLPGPIMAIHVHRQRFGEGVKITCSLCPDPWDYSAQEVGLTSAAASWAYLHQRAMHPATISHHQVDTVRPGRVTKVTIFGTLHST